MKLGIVIGVVWASRKVKEIDGCRMYIVQPISSDGKINDTALVTADPKRLAAPGDKVLYVTLMRLKHSRMDLRLLTPVLLN